MDIVLFDEELTGQGTVDHCEEDQECAECGQYGIGSLVEVASLADVPELGPVGT